MSFRTNTVQFTHCKCDEGGGHKVFQQINLSRDKHTYIQLANCYYMKLKQLEVVVKVGC